MISKYFMLYILAGLSTFALPLAPSLAQSVDLGQVARNATNLTADRVNELKKQLEKDPNDLVARVSLISYYWMRFGAKGVESRCENILWLIRNHPENEIVGQPRMELDMVSEAVCYGKAKKVWLQIVADNPNSTPILGNASSFFLLNESSEAERLLLLARELEPNNMEWAERLGQLYSLKSIPQKGGEDARKALKYYEIALKLAAFPERSYILKNAAVMAVAGGQNDKAELYAKQLLDAAVEGTAWSYGHAVYYGNLVLGRVALSNGAIEEAEYYLLLSGRTPGSPSLGSFGPNMLLAKELLERGRKEAVLKYLALCGKFWKRKRGKLNAWIKIVESGGMPDFGANLRY